MILLQATKTWIDSLRFSPDGRYLAALDASNHLRVWDDPVRNRKPGTPRVCTSAEFLPTGGKLLLVGVWDHDLGRRRCLLTDLAGGPDTELLLGGDGRGYLWCGPTPDGQHLLRVQRDPRVGYQTDLSVRKIDAPGRVLWRVKTDDEVDSPPAFLPGGDQFSLFHWREVVVRGLAGGAIQASAPNKDGWRHAVAGWDGQLLAGRRGSRAAVLRADALTSKPVVLKSGGRKEFTGLAFHPSGKYLAATSNDATVKVYDVETWALERVFSWQVGRMRSIAFSPDGMLAAAGSDTGQVVLWDWDL